MATEKSHPASPTSATEFEVAQKTATITTQEDRRDLDRLDTKGIHEFRETEGYVLDQLSSDNDDDNHRGAARGVKLAADGHTRLIPQPSDDPNDPLNWSWIKKHTILFVVAAAAFLPDYGSATGAVTLQLQAEYVSLIFLFLSFLLLFSSLFLFFPLFKTMGEEK